MRRLLAIIGVLGGVAVPAVPASAAQCTDPRLVSVAATRVVEGTARLGYTTMTFTVDSTGCAQPGVVSYRTVAYTAREKYDFVPVSGRLEYVSGQTGARTVTVQVVPDAVAEPVECLSLQLAVGVGSVRADPAEAVGLIVDDDFTGAARGFRCSE